MEIIANSAPRLASRHLAKEDSALVCDTCPGELGRPEAVYQAEPGEQSYWHVIGVMAGVGLASLLIVHFLAKTGSLP